MTARLRHIAAFLGQPGQVGRSIEGDEATARRSVVPDAAGRSLWLAAVWTGLGAAIVCATVAIVVVATCWLPVSGTTGRTNSAIRAGLLSFLASVHGGITVDGTSTAWLPLGLPLIVAVAAWRAGSGLADAADTLGERHPVRLALAGVAQSASFTIGCLIAVPFATLGTSRAPLLGVGCAALVLFAVSGGTALLRSSPLREWSAIRMPAWLAPVVRAGAAAVAVYLTAGALLVAGSLVVHHTAVEALSAKVGGGWGGVPILLLGLLAAPNAVIAGSSYLAGPGFAVGTGTTVSVFGTAHGTLPAFPLLAALPVRHGANPVVWTAVTITTLLAGIVVARLSARTDGWLHRFARTAAAVMVAGLVMGLLAWQGGGSVGAARLHTVGASPWRLAGAVAVELGLVSGTALGVVAGWRALRRRSRRQQVRQTGEGHPTTSRGRLNVVATQRSKTADAEQDGELAG